MTLEYSPVGHIDDVLNRGTADLGGLLEQAAHRFPEAGVHYIASGPATRGSSAYPDLHNQALSMLGALRENGAVPGHPVVLLLEHPGDFLPAIWACLLGGLPACPVAVGQNTSERIAAQVGSALSLLDHPLVVTTASIREQVSFADKAAVLCLEQLTPGRPREAPVHRHQCEPDDLALLLMTSGSTGAPKLVELTHANLLASVSAKAELFGLTRADTVLNWISFDHVAAFEEHLLPMSVGAPQIQATSKIVLADPLELLRLVDAHRVTMTFAPNFLLGLINTALDQRPDGLTLDLTCLQRILTGGEANPVATGAGFLHRLAPHGLHPGALWPAFGMTETCAGSVFNQDFPHGDGGSEFAAVGRGVAGLKIRVADAGTDATVADGDIGEVQLTGPMITRGYHNNREATAAAFTADGWFRTGDRGRLDGGRLTLVGRSKDTIVVNGVNYHSHDLEAVLNDLGGIEKSFIAVFPTRPADCDTEQLVVAFAPATPAGDEAALHRQLVAVRNSVVLHWGFRPSVLLPLPKEAFPKTSLGKIQRSLMRKRLEAGEYAETTARVEDLIIRQLGGYSPAQGAIETALVEVYAEIFETSPAAISATASFFDLGGTSLDILRLKRRIAERFPGIETPVVTILTAPTARGLARHIDLGRSGGAAPYDPIVPLQTTGTGTPLFCVHPGVGEVLVFVNLAKYFIHERPFYALRARGFDTGDQPFQTFTEMVETYADAIRVRQPHGPYAIVGYSFGAAVAFEIAKLLEAQGEQVAFLGNLNLPAHIKHRMNELDFVDNAVNLAMFLGLVTKQQTAEVAERLRPLSRLEQISHLISISPPGRLAELALDEVKFSAWVDVAHGLTRLGRTYQPSGKTRAMTVFCADPFRGTRQEWLEQLQRWEEFTTTPLRHVPIAGEHYTLMGTAHVASLQTVLRDEVNRALADVLEQTGNVR